MRWGLALGCLLTASACDRVFGLDERPPIDAPSPPPPEWMAVAAGTAHTCAVATDRTLWCWGENARGQCGLPGAPAEVIVPTKVGDARWISVASGYDHTCVIDEANALWCWGSNFQNAVGAMSLADDLPPTKVLEDVTAVATGYSHTCAIRGDQTMWCWGRNMEGELALPPNNNEPVPRQIMSDLRWTKVAAGLFHTCGITTDGAFMCWGVNTNQQSVVGGSPQYDVPQSVEPGTQWIDVAVGYQHTCAVRANGTIRCQGFNSRGQLGAVTQSGVLVDELQTGEPGRTWTRVLATVDQTCALRDDGGLWCWGSNAQNATGLGTIGQATAPTRVVDGRNWTQVAIGFAHLCAIDASGVLSCTGTDGSGQLGTGQGGGKLVPTRVDGTWKTAAVGDGTVCARDLSGAVWCWGDNGLGQIGDGTIDPKQKPEFVVAGLIDGALAVGADHACARTEANPNPLISCWGSNSLGELGTGNSNYRQVTPQPLTTPTSPLELTAGSHTCAITQGEVLHCWGANRYAQLGFARDTSPHSTPLFLAATWGVIAGGSAHTCGVRTQPAGNLECWGDNRRGQRGTAATQVEPAPVMTGIKSVALGGEHSCAITTAARLHCWGANTEGQVGDDSLTDRATPRTIGTASWQQIALGLRHTCGLQFEGPSGGSLWCWGHNGRGQLGAGTRIDAKLPTRIGTDTDWRFIVAGGDETCAIKNDDSLWCWGANATGQIGDGSAWTFELVRIAP